MTRYADDDDDSEGHAIVTLTSAEKAQADVINSQPVQTVPLVSLNDAPQGGFFSRLWDSIMLWFHSSKGNTEQAPGQK